MISGSVTVSLPTDADVTIGSRGRCAFDGTQQ